MAELEYVPPSTPLLEKWGGSSSSSRSSSSDDAGSGTDSNRAPEAVERMKSGGGGEGGGRNKSLAVLTGHSGSVHCLAVCGEYVLSASDGRDIVAWRQPDLRRFARFGHGGGGSVKALAAVGGHVFSAHQDGRIRVWQVCPRGAGGSENAFRLAATLPTARDRLGKILMQGSYVQTRRHHRKLWIEHADSISCLAVDGGAVYSGSWDKTLKVWRLSDLKCIESIKAHDDAVNALAAGGGAVFSASADGKIKIWTRPPRALNHSLKAVLEAEAARKGAVPVSWNAVVVADGGRAAYGGGSDGRVVGWEEEAEGKWRVACELRAHEMSVLCLSICCRGEVLCSGSADKSIGLWRRAAKVGGGGGGIYRIGVVRGHEGPVKCVLASGFRVGDGFMLYSGGFDKSLRVWWVDGGKEEALREADDAQGKDCL
ncbi:protein JINGUBANG [Curcuma longa]|uniref:protein JINGUBANG n=1 Tax=Curcuma longa TaxID=136217 RepID=UPI003D9FA09A